MRVDARVYRGMGLRMLLVGCDVGGGCRYSPAGRPGGRGETPPPTPYENLMADCGVLPAGFSWWIFSSSWSPAVPAEQSIRESFTPMPVNEIVMRGICYLIIVDVLCAGASDRLFSYLA